MCSFGKDGKVKCPEYDSHPTTNGANRYAIAFTAIGLPAIAYRGPVPSRNYGLEHAITNYKTPQNNTESYKH